MSKPVCSYRPYVLCRTTQASPMLNQGWMFNVWKGKKREAIFIHRKSHFGAFWFLIWDFVPNESINPSFETFFEMLYSLSMVSASSLLLSNLANYPIHSSFVPCFGCRSLHRIVWCERGENMAIAKTCAVTGSCANGRVSFFSQSFLLRLNLTSSFSNLPSSLNKSWWKLFWKFSSLLMR